MGAVREALRTNLHYTSGGMGLKPTGNPVRAGDSFYLHDSEGGLHDADLPADDCEDV
jgi:hypothetical protein